MFTDYFDNVEARYTYVGNSMIVFTVVIILMNMGFLMYFFGCKLLSYYKYRQSKKRWIDQENFMMDLHKTGKDVSIYDPTLTVSQRIHKDMREQILKKKKFYHQDLLKMESLGLYMTDLQKEHLSRLNRREEAKKKKKLLE